MKVRGNVTLLLVTFLLVFAVPSFLLARNIQRVSISSTGEQGNDGSCCSSLSSDGRFVVFRSGANNLVPGDSNNWTDIFIHDLFTGVTERVSVSSTGEQGNGDSNNGRLSFAPMHQYLLPLDLPPRLV
jgi:hypothetical protein